MAVDGERPRAASPTATDAASLVSSTPRTAHVYAGLRALGFTSAEADAVELLWDHSMFTAAWSAPVVFDFWCAGLDPHHAYDAALHDLEGIEAQWYIIGGLTGHQAATLEQDETARRNLYGSRRTRSLDEVQRLLTCQVPAEFRYNVLRVAGSASEARRWLLQAERHLASGQGPLIERYIRRHKEVDRLAALLPDVPVRCACELGTPDP